MRSLLLYADQLQRMLTTLPGPQAAILETLREKLREEPCVKDSPGCRQGSNLLPSANIESVFLAPCFQS
jgi:hypothetical protein